MVDNSRIHLDYQKLITHTTIPTYTTTQDGDILEVNNAFLNILEFTWEELQQRKAVELFKNKIDRHNMLHVLSEKGYFNDRMLVLETKSGKTKYFLESSTQQIHPQYHVILQGFLLDITDQIEAEDRLRILDRGIEKSPISIVIWNAKNRIEYANPAFSELTGLRYDEIVNQHPNSLVGSPDDFDDIDTCIRSDRIWSGEIHNHHVDGTSYVIQTTIVPVHNRNNILTHFLGILQDMTEAIGKDRLIKENESKFRMLFNNAQVGIILANIEHNIVDVNDYFAKMVGYTREELLGHDYQIFTHPDDLEHTKQHLQDAWQNKSTRGYDKRYITKTGEQVWGNISISMTNFSGKDHFVISVSNITRRKEIEQRESELRNSLLQATKFEAIGRLSGNIAHDFNNLLTIIMNNTELIKLANENELLEPYLRDIERSSRYGANIVSNLLKFSRKSSTSKTELSINQILSSIVTMLETGLGPKIKLLLSLDEDAIIFGNESDLSSAIMNLGLNAIEALSDNGGEISIMTRKTNEKVIITISDTGEGISPELVNQIFEPFYSTKADGTGLGLSSALGIIKEHNGQLNVDSVLDRGTTFVITLPIHLAQPIEAIKSESKYDAGKNIDLHLMFVDDEESILTTTSHYFRQRGYVVSAFKSSLPAEEFFKENWQDIDLVILDLNLGEKTGLETLHVLQKINPRIRVIFYSGYLDIDSEVERSSSVVKVLTKPMNLQSLEREIVNISFDDGL